jgi:hypothetical protein
MGPRHLRLRTARPAPAKRAARAGFRPRLEALEARALLAILGLDIQLLADNGGQPGAPFSNASDLVHGSAMPLEVGDFFWVQVVAWDQRAAATLPTGQNPSPGVISLPLNLAWDTSVIDFVGSTPDGDPGPNPGQADLPVPIASLLLTPNFTQQRFLTDFDEQTNNPTALDGFADPTNANLLGLRGGAIPVAMLGAPIGTIGPPGTDAAPAWFSRLRFQAVAAAGQSPFVMQLAGSMAFADAAGLDAITHLVPDGNGFAPADELNRVTEFIQIVEAPRLASLSGYVYVDTNPTNGVLDRDGNGVAVEFGIPNVTLSLFGQNNQLVGTTTTGADGSYLFDGLQADIYRIVETQPPLFFTSASSVGTILPPNQQRGIAGVDEISEIRVALDEDGVDYNFGEIPVPDKRMFLARTDMRLILAGQRGVTARTVSGTPGNDTIVVEATNNVLVVTVNNAAPQQFPLETARILYVDAKGGQDSVEFVGTSAAEVAQLSPGTGTLRRGEDYSAANYAIMAVAAEQVIADAGSGDDLAVLRDSPANDALVAAGPAATLATIDNRLAQAIAFDRVRALSLMHSATEQDTANVAATDYLLDLEGNWLPI